MNKRDQIPFLIELVQTLEKLEQRADDLQKSTDADSAIAEIAAIMLDSAKLCYKALGQPALLTNRDIIDSRVIVCETPQIHAIYLMVNDALKNLKKDNHHRDRDGFEATHQMAYHFSVGINNKDVLQNTGINAIAHIADALIQSAAVKS
jgi:hypothetical protein